MYRYLCVHAFVWSRGVCVSCVPVVCFVCTGICYQTIECICWAFYVDILLVLLFRTSLVEEKRCCGSSNISNFRVRSPSITSKICFNVFLNLSSSSSSSRDPLDYLWLSVTILSFKFTVPYAFLTMYFIRFISSKVTFSCMLGHLVWSWNQLPFFHLLATEYINMPVNINVILRT